MLAKYVGMLTIHLLAETTLSSGQTCSPTTSPPASIPPLGGDAPSQIVGDWFAYRRSDMTTNHRVRNMNFGPTVEPNTNTTAANAIVLYSQMAWLSNGVCQNEFWTGYYNMDGSQTGLDALSTDNYSVIRFRDYSVLYHDYQKFMLAYGCAKPNKDGTCASPIIWSQTRTRPDQLSASDMDNFDSIINNALKNYCLSVQNMPKQVHDDKQQNCPLNDQPPACIGSLNQGMQALIPGSGQAAAVVQQENTTSTGYGSSTPISACKWPVNINASRNGSPGIRDPSQTAGVWYVYRTRYGLEPTSINMRHSWTIVNDGILASSNLTGSFAWAEYTQYSAPSDTQCNHGYWTGLIATTEGAGSVGVRFIANDTGDTQVPLNPMMIYQDDKYMFLYGCYLPNLVTGLCDGAFSMLSARTNPGEWSQSEKDQVDSSIITPLLKDYGCSASDMRIMPHNKDKPECAFQGTTACLNAYIAGYKEQAPQPKPPAYY